MLHFVKYHGAGNDFILIDDRENYLHERFARRQISRWCDRHFGIGADGMMFLRSREGYDFEMVYYNSDGAPSSMCGNGARCIVRFAADLGVIQGSAHFLAVDGPHRAEILPDGGVSLSMSDVARVERHHDGAYLLDTGSPHYIRLDCPVDSVDVVAEGRKVRYAEPFAATGVNVNFVERTADKTFAIATYERGVEDETLACGTGVTAAAIAGALNDGLAEGQAFRYELRAKGGSLAVSGRLTRDGATDLKLIGPAVRVFSGRSKIDHEAQG